MKKKLGRKIASFSMVIMMEIASLICIPRMSVKAENATVSDLEENINGNSEEISIKEEFFDKEVKGEKIPIDIIPCEVYRGSNIESQDYYKSANPMYSYISKCSNDNFMVVEKIIGSQKISIQYFDNSFNFLGNGELELDLPIFAGFYETDNNYFLLTGQNNINEDDRVEVFRITKYDKNWKKIDSCGLFGANTYAPFKAGSARMTTVNEYLFIHTCHEMYTSEDGINNQANVTFQINMSTMDVTDSFTEKSDLRKGYVSNSLNQFICADGNNIVTLDHGDTYPRSVVLIKYPEEVNKGTFLPTNNNWCKAIDLITFNQSEDKNYTGYSIGGFEISDTAYIVAGSKDKDREYLSRVEGYEEERDIFIVTMDKNTEKISFKSITNYEEGQGITSTPHLSKIGNNLYMLLWHKGNQVYYVKVDGNGNTIGNIYSITGDLSDCEPIINGNNLIWYTREYEIKNFYSINTVSMKANKTEVNTGHNWNSEIIDVEPTCLSDGSKVCTCDVCKEKKTVIISALGHNYELDWTVDKEASCTEKGIKSRHCTRCDSVIDKMDILALGHDWDSIKIEPTCTTNGEYIFTCKVCKTVETSTIDAYGHYFLPHWTTDKLATCTEEGRKSHHCYRCDSINDETVIPALGHNYSSYWTIDKGETCTEDGLMSHHCRRCESIKDETVIPRTGHRWDSGEIIKKPTYDEEGVIRYTCLGCSITKDEILAKKEVPAETPMNLHVEINNNDRFGLSETLIISNSNLEFFEYCWYARMEGDNSWIEICDWTQTNCIFWTPEVFGTYIVEGKVRSKGHPETEKSVSYTYEYHPQIKGKCQMPYSGEQGVGYLIGVESYENPNQSYQYEMLILDCTLLAQGLPAWTYTTGKFTVPEGNAGWCIWTPQYGYYWTLFRVYDENGVLIDEQCYGFQNIC